MSPLPLVLAPSPLPVFGRLIAVHRNGSDGEVYSLRGTDVELGRTEGDLLFADDRYVAARHARVEKRGAAVFFKPLEALNGVYLRLRDPWQLQSGDRLLIGRECLCIEAMDPEEKNPQPLVQHGVMLFASPVRQPWARLRQVSVSGATRDVYHLIKPEVVVGREEGELRFPDDEFMSRRHAMFANHEGRLTLTDLGSSNGTYVRLRGERELKPGDYLRMGDRLLRFEAV